MQSLCYNGKHIEFFDPSQVRDENGRWTSGGASAGGSADSNIKTTTREAGTDNGKQSTSVYHGTSADVLKKIRENGLQPSRDGVYGKGVYATNHLEVALEYGAMKASDAPRIGGKSYIGLIEVVSSGFEEVSKYTDPTRKTKGDKKGDSISILLKKSKVAPSEIKSMKLFDLGQVRSWIFEGGKKPDPVATKKLEAGTYYIPIVIHEDEITKLEETKCPLPTQDIKENLANRQKAIDVAHYGPANPKEPNEDYWTTKAKIFGGSVKEAKTMLCGNCAGFNQTTKLMNCISKGIGMDAKEVEQAGDLGYCEIFDFKCASLRTCDAWIVGGPITDSTNLDQLKEDLLELKKNGATLLYDPSQARDESGRWSGNSSISSNETKVENEIIEEKFSDSAIPLKPLDNEVEEDVKSENPKSTGIAGTGQCTQCALDEYKKKGGEIYVGYTIEKPKWEDALQKHDPKLWYGWNWQGEKGKDEKKHYALNPVVHAWNVISDKIVDRAIGGKEAKKTKYIGYKIPKKIADQITNPDDLFKWKEIAQKAKEFSYDPNQPRDDSGRWSGSGGSSLSDKLTSKIAKENPDIDLKDSKVKKAIKAVSDGVQGARMKVQYGASKIADIRSWVKSEAGRNFIDGTTKALKVTSKGIVEAGKEIHKERFSILTSAIAGIGIGPELAIAHGGYALLKGFVRGAVTEYRKGKGGTKGREVSNTIREVAGLKPMQACNSIVTLQKEPSDDDLIDYLTDVLAVSIKDKIRGTTTFQITGFAFDPSQERDENGRWVSKGGGGASKEPEMPIYDEDENQPISPIGNSEEELTQAEKIEKELNPSEQEYAQEFMQVLGPPKREHTLGQYDEQYKEDVIGWSKAFAEKEIGKEEAVQIAQGLHKYAGDGHRDVNKALREMEDSSKKSDAPDLNSLEVASLMEKALDVAPKIKENEIWRGMKTDTDKPLSQNMAHRLAKTAKVGDNITDLGFSSFSLSPSVAEEFANWNPKAKKEKGGYASKVLINVKNAQGVGVKMPSFASSFFDEKEVLLRPETPLKITSVQRTRIPIAGVFKGEDKYVYQTKIEAQIIK